MRVIELCVWSQVNNKHSKEGERKNMKNENPEKKKKKKRKKRLVYACFAPFSSFPFPIILLIRKTSHTSIPYLPPPITSTFMFLFMSVKTFLSKLHPFNRPSSIYPIHSCLLPPPPKPPTPIPIPSKDTNCRVLHLPTTLPLFRMS